MEDESFDDFVIELSTNRSWAGNNAIQAAANALSVCQKFEKGNVNVGKLEWYKEKVGQNIYRHNDYVDFCGSDSTTIRRQLSTTPLVSRSTQRSCVSCHQRSNNFF